MFYCQPNIGLYGHTEITGRQQSEPGITRNNIELLSKIKMSLIIKLLCLSRWRRGITNAVLRFRFRYPSWKCLYNLQNIYFVI